MPDAGLWQAALAPLKRELDRIVGFAQTLTTTLLDPSRVVDSTGARRERDRERDRERLRDAQRAHDLADDLHAGVERLPSAVLGVVGDLLLKALELGRIADDAVYNQWMATEALEALRRQQVRARKAAESRKTDGAREHEKLRARALRVHREHPELGVTGVAALLDPTHAKQMKDKLLRLGIHWHRRKT